ncbi:hypothetical protein B5F80_07440 [Megasphaera sp. An286]|nr:hypothetical protein B5F80_07440 [Megasphaera sp. An286]
MRRTKRVPLNFWETAKRGDEYDVHFSRLGDSLLDSPTFCKLGNSTRLIYFYMIRAAAGKREFTFSHSFYDKRGFAKRTVIRAIMELENAGFIRVKEHGKATRTPNQYRFINDWKNEE